MPVNSPNYPPGGFSNIVPNVQAVGAMTGRLVDDNGAVTGLAVRGAAVLAGHYVWEALGYLDVIETRTRDFPALRQSLDTLGQSLGTLAGMIQQLSTKLDRMNEQLGVLGVTIPEWTFRSKVLNGDWDVGGNRIPSAAELGLVVTFDVVQIFEDQTPGKVFAIEPPAGTFVARGSHVTVTVGFGEE